MGGFHAAAGRSEAGGETTKLPSSTPPQIPPGQPTTNPAKLTPVRALNKYLDEIIDYGGYPHTRAEVIADMQQSGTPQPCIDRWLQGQEHAQRLRERKAPLAALIYLAERRPRILCR